MSNPAFDFFEAVAEELCADTSRVLLRTNFQLDRERAPLLDSLKQHFAAATTEDAMREAVDSLTDHFSNRGAQLPFTYDGDTGRFTAVDQDFLCFVKEMKSIRSIGKRSRDFELGVMRRLQLRVTGSLHRVGDPRDVRKKKAQFNEYLRSIGFKGTVLLGKERDGGFDILWVLPLGSRSHRPLVSLQCKNAEFDIGEADKSVGAGSRSLSEHGGLQPTVHVPCVVFNDYIVPGLLTPKAMNFVPLGLTDLALPTTPITAEAI